MKSLTAGEIAGACSGKLVGVSEDLTISNVSIDNRNVLSGGLFVPIIGEVHDGHKFIPAAFSAGAVCTLSDRNVDFPHILVADTLVAFQSLARFQMSRANIPVVGITGSVGKTTTKDMITCVLAEEFEVHKTQGNFNNETGVPLTVFDLPQSAEVAVIEMGMNHAGEIDRLANIVKPDICVITNIGVAHIENLGSKQGIFEAKCEMLPHMKAGGSVIVNGQDEYLGTLKSKGAITAGFDGCDIYATDIVSRGFDGVDFNINCENICHAVSLSVPGEHMIINALIAASVGLKLGMNMEQICAGLAKFAPSKGRMQVQKRDGITVIDDAYNANPTSMAAAIRTLGGAQGRKVLVMGDMLELGKDAHKYHADMGVLAAECNIDLVVCVGELSKNTCDAAMKLGTQAMWFENLQSVQSEIANIVCEGDTVLIKSSHGTGLHGLVI